MATTDRDQKVIGALFRELSPNFAASAISMEGREEGPISQELAERQHQSYVALVKQILSEQPGSPPRFHTISGDPETPDCNFIEDTLVIAPIGTDKADQIIREKDGEGFCGVVTRLGHDARRGESAAVEEAVRKVFPKLQLVVQQEGRLDGGDVLTIVERRVILVGLSSRTNAEGVTCLRRAFSPRYQVHAVEVPAGLHLKSFVTAVDGNFLVVGEAESFLKVVRDAVASIPALSGIQLLPVPSVASSNILQLGDKLLVRTSCPESLRRLCNAFGPERLVLSPDLSELEKADGAFTCGCVLLYNLHGE